MTPGDPREGRCDKSPEMMRTHSAPFRGGSIVQPNELASHFSRRDWGLAGVQMLPKRVEIGFWEINLREFWEDKIRRHATR